MRILAWLHGQIVVDGVPINPPGTGSGHFTVAVQLNPDGPHNIVVHVFDAVGNSTTCSFTSPIVDTTPPACGNLQLVNLHGVTADILVDVSDPGYSPAGSGIAKVELYVNGLLQRTQTSPPLDAAGEQVVFSGVDLYTNLPSPSGIVSYYVIVQDRAGHRSVISPECTGDNDLTPADPAPRAVRGAGGVVAVWPALSDPRVTDSRMALRR